MCVIVITQWHTSETPLSRSKGQGHLAALLTAVLARQAAASVGVLAVGNCCFVAVCSAAEGASVPTGGGWRRGAGDTVEAARLQLVMQVQESTAANCNNLLIKRRKILPFYIVQKVQCYQYVIAAKIWVERICSTWTKLDWGTSWTHVGHMQWSHANWWSNAPVTEYNDWSIRITSSAPQRVKTVFLLLLLLLSVFLCVLTHFSTAIQGEVGSLRRNFDLDALDATIWKIGTMQPRCQIQASEAGVWRGSNTPTIYVGDILICISPIEKSNT